MDNRIVNPPANGRQAARARRREQLIEATIAAIARRGISQMTLTDVAREAGVSHGLVNFHFETKERLLAETLRALSAEHRANWEEALEKAGSSPEERLNALILAEFAAPVSKLERVSAWCSFWGEAQNRPLYLAQCSEDDAAYERAFERACEALAREGGYDLDTRRAARLLRLAIEGVWLELMFSTQPYSEDEALRTVFFCAASLFPRHFTAEGLIRG
jgi:TetR/AcrR family transcriptional repressor of bet genes